MRLLPPQDLLERISGIEEGLKENRKAKRLGTFGLVFSCAQLALGASSTFGADLFRGDLAWLGPVLVGAGAFVLGCSLALVGRTRMWLRDSSTPFGYTCSLVQFAALNRMAQENFAEVPVWMKYDLAEMLNARIGRLSFLEEASAAPDGSRTFPSELTTERPPSTEHIRVSGDLLVRRKGNGTWVMEVTPRVQVGGSDAAATLGHPVSYDCTAADPGVGRAPTSLEGPPDDPANQLHTSAGSNVGSDREQRPCLPEADYEKIVERVYFSIATQIYRQIRADVQRKIDLLPTRFLRANAYYHEAEDYARSNTLDALDAARELYLSAMELFDPRLRPLPKPKVRRPYLVFLRWKAKVVQWWRVRGSKYWPRLAKSEVLTARAEIGYANVLLYRRTLAGLSGHRMNSIYEARPVAERALERLEEIPLDVPGCRQARFDAHVALALACYQLELDKTAESSLAKARSMLPSCYDEDARYLYVAGMLEPQARFAIRLHRQAVERDPRLEVAQFELALRSEMMWRTRPKLEQPVADLVQEEYQRALKINPGNLRAWENIAYVRWLLGDLDAAAEAYERGREFKQMKPDAALGSIEYGLARVKAEQGDFKSAYRHYLGACSAQLVNGVSDAKWTSAQFYFFDFVGDAMMARYDEYLRRAAAHGSAGSEDEDRLRKIVYSFVLNDHAEACHTYYIRNCSPAALRRAFAEYDEAKGLNPDAMLPHYNLYLLHRYLGNVNEALDELHVLQKMEPGWADGILAGVAALAESASEEVVFAEIDPTQADAVPDSARRKAHAVAKEPKAVQQLQALLPHEWLWRGESFNWQAPYRADLQDSLRWERELNDLHVRALFLWVLSHLVLTESQDDHPKLFRIPKWLRRTADAQVFLDCIRRHFWPGNFNVLLASYRLQPDRAAVENLQATIERWLRTDPTAYWALDLITTGFRDRQHQMRPLVSEEKRREYLKAARDELPTDSELRQWVEEKLQEVGSSST